MLHCRAGPVRVAQADLGEVHRDLLARIDRLLPREAGAGRLPVMNDDCPRLPVLAEAVEAPEDRDGALLAVVDGLPDRLFDGKEPLRRGDFGQDLADEGLQTGMA